MILLSCSFLYSFSNHCPKKSWGGGDRAEQSSELAPSGSALQERGWQDNLDSPVAAVASARWNNVKRSNKSKAPVEHSDGGHRSERRSPPGERVRSGMSPSSNDTGRADPPDSGSEQRLLNRVRRGRSSAVNALFERYAPWLRRRASGRLPQWARSGVATSDLVQDVLHHTFARLNWFESKHVSALRTYLRRYQGCFCHLANLARSLTTPRSGRTAADTRCHASDHAGAGAGRTTIRDVSRRRF